MTLSKKHVENICLLYQGTACCRYLGPDDVFPYKFHCLKHKSELKKKIDEVVDKSLASTDPAHKSAPTGNNCSGYPILKNIEQGYDV